MKKAFSLAETLTVLTLIGAVAAILIPLLNVNVEKQKLESGIKRLYSSFSINVKTVLNEKNCASISCLRAYPSGETDYRQHEIMIKDVDADGNEIEGSEHKGYERSRGHVFANPKYFGVASECADTDCPTEDDENKKCNQCLAPDIILPTGTEAQRNIERPKYKIYRLNNAAVMALYNFDAGNCLPAPDNRLRVRNERGEYVNMGVCGIVLFDVNGLKGPNMPGRDLFAFYIADEPVNNSYIVPIGLSAANSDGSVMSYIGTNDAAEADMARALCKKVKHRQAYNCTANLMLNNWKMNY